MLRLLFLELTTTDDQLKRVLVVQSNRTRSVMLKFLATALITLLPSLALAQDPGEIQRLFEAGRYQQVVEATTPQSPPEVLYTAAQSQQKMGANDQALQTYSRLAERPESDPWHFIGLSGRQLVEGNIDGGSGIGATGRRGRRRPSTRALSARPRARSATAVGRRGRRVRGRK